MTSFFFLMSFMALISAGVLCFVVRMTWQWLWPKMTRAVTLEEFHRARSDIEIAIEAMPAFRRVFSEEDIKGYCGIHPSGVKSLAKERKAMALRWLRQTQQHVTEFVGVYWRLTPCVSAPPGLWNELQDGLCYVRFLIVCLLLRTIVWIRGPFGCGRIVNYTFSVSGKLREVARLRLERIDPSQLRPAEGRRVA